MDQNEKLALKYRFIRDKIFTHYARGVKYVKIAKIVVAVLFVLFTVVAVALCRHDGNVMLWLMLWVGQIFINVLIFVIVDYVRYLIDDKVMPYLLDDNVLEFGEYDIFNEDDENDEEEEDDD